MIKLLFFGFCIILFSGFVFANNDNVVVNNNVHDDCVPEWVCDSFSDCLENNIEVCVGVSDNNRCHVDFVGKIDDFNVDCVFIPPCIPDWSCDSFDVCSRDNVLSCLSIVDNNRCDIVFHGNFRDFDSDCVFVNVDVIINDFFVDKIFKNFGVRGNHVVVKEHFVNNGRVLANGVDKGFCNANNEHNVRGVNIDVVDFDGRDITIISTR